MLMMSHRVLLCKGGDFALHDVQLHLPIVTPGVNSFKIMLKYLAITGR